MIRRWLTAVSVGGLFALPTLSFAQSVGGPVRIASVFSGNSSLEADSVGFAIAGNPLNAPASCYNSANNTTFFYLSMSPTGKDRAMSALLTAQSTDRLVYIAYSSAAANTMYFYSPATTCAVGAVWVASQ